MLTIVDRCSRWPDAFPIPNSSAETVAKVVLVNWISTFGLRSVIKTDRGSHYESIRFKDVFSLLPVKHIRNTAYHQCDNGVVERFHR